MTTVAFAVVKQKRLVGGSREWVARGIRVVLCEVRVCTDYSTNVCTEYVIRVLSSVLNSVSTE